MQEPYIAHYGIKGQKWGVRRFQEENGEYTQAGRTRYGIGRGYDRERYSYETKEVERMKKESKKFQKNEQDAKRIAEKYGLNENGEGGDRSSFSKAELRRARNRFWEKKEDNLTLESEFESKANKKSYDKIKEKYGQTALDDIEHYHKRNRQIATAFISSVAVIGLASQIRRAKKQKSRVNSFNPYAEVRRMQISSASRFM